MLIRIVKMTFRPEFVDEFTQVFDKYKEHIRGSEGCMHLELLRDVNNPNIFFTYSHWEDADYLENYRHSEVFKEVWPLTKAGFSEKPEAWSIKREWNSSES
ncbi:MAG: quinol monooxygenase YgiN [Flavobacteriales bacterium]|jgi:quinol monooxygenase YgiN